MGKVFVEGKAYSSIQEAKDKGAKFPEKKQNVVQASSRTESIVMKIGAEKTSPSILPSDVKVSSINKPKDSVLIKSPKGQGANVDLQDIKKVTQPNVYGNAIPQKIGETSFSQRTQKSNESVEKFKTELKYLGKSPAEIIAMQEGKGTIEIKQGLGGKPTFMYSSFKPSERQYIKGGYYDILKGQSFMDIPEKKLSNKEKKNIQYFENAIISQQKREQNALNFYDKYYSPFSTKVSSFATNFITNPMFFSFTTPYNEIQRQKVGDNPENKLTYLDRQTQRSIKGFFDYPYQIGYTIPMSAEKTKLFFMGIATNKETRALTLKETFIEAPKYTKEVYKRALNPLTEEGQLTYIMPLIPATYRGYKVYKNPSLAIKSYGDINFKGFTGKEYQGKSMYKGNSLSYSESFTNYKGKTKWGTKYNIYEYIQDNKLIKVFEKQGPKKNYIQITQNLNTNNAKLSIIKNNKITRTTKIEGIKPQKFDFLQSSYSKQEKNIRLSNDYISQNILESGKFENNKNFLNFKQATRLDSSVSYPTKIKKSYIYQDNLNKKVIYDKNIQNKLYISNNNKPIINKAGTYTKNILGYDKITLFEKTIPEVNRVFRTENFFEGIIKGKKAQSNLGFETKLKTKQKTNLLFESKLKTKEVSKISINIYKQSYFKSISPKISVNYKNIFKENNITPIQKQNYIPIQKERQILQPIEKQIYKPKQIVIPSIKSIITPIQKQNYIPIQKERQILQPIEKQIYKPSIIPNFIPKIIIPIEPPPKIIVPFGLGLDLGGSLRQRSSSFFRQGNKAKYTATLVGKIFNIRAKIRSPLTSGINIRGI